MDQALFKQFFSQYSQNVDHADQQDFWRLSDALIEHVLRKHLPAGLDENAVVLDAGGGTGRWIIKLSAWCGSRFALYDLSEDMLAKAKDNVHRAGIESRVSFAGGDLCDMAAVPDASIDHLVSIYNPLSFVDDPAKAVTELFRILKPGGRAMVMGQGLYNAMASKINNTQAPAAELAALDSESVVRWSPAVPSLHVFSAESLSKLFTQAGFSIAGVYGLPVFIQPGPEDFDSENKQISRVSQALRDPAFFDQVFALETKYHGEPAMVNRGMNLLVVGQK